MATSIKFNLSTRNYIIVVGAGAVLVFAFAVLIGQGEVQTIISQTKVQVAKNKANTQLDANITVADSLISNYLALKDNKTLLVHALPTDAAMPSLVANLENMANSSGLKMSSIEPNQNPPAPLTPSSADAPAPQSTSVTLTLNGSYNNFRAFLDKVENSSRAMRITATQISGSGSNLAIQMSLTTYYMPNSTLPLKTETIK